MAAELEPVTVWVVLTNSGYGGGGCNVIEGIFASAEAAMVRWGGAWLYDEDADIWLQYDADDDSGVGAAWIEPWELWE